MALLALPLAVLGRVVSSTEAASAARAWAREGAHLGARVGEVVESVAAQYTTNDAPFFVVKMSGGGTVFTAGDTEVAPIVAFTAAAEDFSTLDPKSPVWALLNRDLSSRTRVRVPPAARNAQPKRALLALSSGAALAAAEELRASPDANERAWGELLAADANSGKRLMAAPKASIGDVCVAPLVRSKWSQSTHNDARSGKATYNFCTPQTNEPFSAGIYTVTNDGIHNAVCGCVATAMGQLMRYHKYPDADNAVTNRLKHTCWFDDKKIELTMQGGVYDWDLMTLEPKTDPSLTEDNRRAIGKITSDAGISVGMMYTLDDSGAFLSDVSAALRSTFHFGQAYFYCLSWDGSAGSTTMFNDTMLNKAVFANLDAGFPVLFGITGAGGHAIVGDGYGYDGGDAFVHLNFGWSGSSDVWYNLPNIGTGYNFDAVNEIVFNALPREKKGAILSGRVYDVYGKPAAGAAVKIYKREPREVLAETNTCASGVFAFVLPPAIYDVEIAFAGGLQAAKRIGVSLNPPTDGTSGDKTYTNPDGTHGVMAVEHYVATSANAGNLREEFRLEWADVVRINDPENGDYYDSLDAALAASTDGDVLYVCHPARLDGTFTITNSVKIVSTNIINIVTRARDAQLHVASNGVLRLEKQHFASADETDESFMIVVSSNGVVQVESDVRVPQGYRTALHTGFAVADSLTEPAFLLCDEGMNAGDRVGVVMAGASEAAAATVNRVLHPFDDEIGGVVVEAGGERFIVWSDLASVDPRDAVASVNGLYRRSLNAVLRHLSATDDSTVLVYTNCTLTATNVVVARNVSIASSDAKQRTVAVAPEAFFEVKEGGALTIRRITFDGQQARRDTFLRANGGTVELSTSGRLAGFYGTNMVSGAICARDGGWVKMTGSGAKISDCWNLAGFVRGELPVVGGGVTLLGANAELTRGQITKCFAPNGGGGVFADRGSKVCVSGDFSAENNAEGESFSSNYTYSDVCVMTASVLCVKGPFTGSVGVCDFYAASFANEKGQTFAVADAALSDADAELAAVHFFNSRAKREGEKACGWFDEAESTFYWDAPPAAPKQCTPAAAAVKVVYAGDDAAAEWYPDLETALDCLTNAATVTLLKTCALSADVEVKHPVLLTADDVSHELTRGSEEPVVKNRELELFTVEICPGASLTLSNVVVDCWRDRNLCAIGDDFFGWTYYYKSCPILFYVNNAEMTLAEGAKIRNMWGNEPTLASCAVGVAGGTFTMLPGSAIQACSNTVEALVQQAGGGAVRVGDAGTFNFFGGTITGCLGQDVGGVAINNESTLRVRGDAILKQNHLLDGVTEANLTVSDDSVFELDAPLAAAVSTIGVMPPFDTRRIGDETNVAASVNAALDLADAQTRTNVSNSAACFRRDTDGARGVLSTNFAGVAYVVFTNGVEDAAAFPYVPCACVTAEFAANPSGKILEGLPALAIRNFTLAGSSVTITATNAVKRGYYTLWYCNEPKGDYVYVDGSEQTGVEGPVTFETTKPESAGAIFWKVIIDEKPYDGE